MLATHRQERRAVATRVPHRPPIAMSPTPSSSARASSSAAALDATLGLRTPAKSPVLSRQTAGTTTSNQRSAQDDDDDLELPVVTTKPLSSIDSIAKFHNIHLRDSVSSTTSTTSSSSRSSRSSSSSYSSSVSSSSSSSSSSSRHRKRPSNPQDKSRHLHLAASSSGSSKKSHKHNRLSALVLHSVSPREGHALNSSGHPTSFTQYDVVVENVRSNEIWQVSRRFSSFVYFRKELTALFETPHCHYCTEMHAKLDALHDDFPSKRLWGSNKPSVVKQRAQKLESYLKGLLELAARSHTKSCKLVASGFALHMRTFLTVDKTEFRGIPGGDFGHMIPSMLQQLSSHAAFAAAHKGASSLATIEEHASGSGSALALMGKIQEAETEEEEDDEEEEEDREHDHLSVGKCIEEEEEEDDGEDDTSSTSEEANQREDHD